MALPNTLANGGWVDPYAEQRALLQARMQQPQQPMYSPEEAAARRAQNEREHTLGILGQLSGDEDAGAVGGVMLKNALANRAQRVSERGVSDPLTGKFSYSPDYLQQQQQAALDKLEGQSASSREQWNRDRQSAEDRKVLKSIGGGGAGGADQARIFRGEDTMRNDFNRITQDLREEVNATGKITQIINANAGRRPDAITQQSLVILLNKFLDPGSVVREAEFDRVVKAQGLEGRASNLKAMLLKGEPLSDAMIAQINGLAQLYQQAAESKMRRVGGEYMEIAKRRGYDPDSVISDPRYRGTPAPAKPTEVDASTLLRTKPQPAPQITPNAPPRTPAGPNRVVEGGW